MGSSGTVFVVDDDQAVAESLRALLMSVDLPVKTYPSAQAFIDDDDCSKQGCLVLDVRMPGMSGLQLQEYLKARKITIPVIFITGHGDVPMAVRAVKAGALDFLEKPFHDQDLLDQVHLALTLEQERRHSAVGRESVRERLDTLTTREREVMDLIVAGKSSKMIANTFNLSCKTIEFHRANVLLKTNVHTTAELIHMVLSAQDVAHPS